MDKLGDMSIGTVKIRDLPELYESMKKEPEVKEPIDLFNRAEALRREQEDRFENVRIAPRELKFETYRREHLADFHKMQKKELDKHILLTEIMGMGSVAGGMGIAYAAGRLGLMDLRVVPLLVPFILIGGIGGALGYFKAAQKLQIPRTIEKKIVAHYDQERNAASEIAVTAGKACDAALNSYVKRAIREDPVLSQMAGGAEGEEKPAVMQEEEYIDIDGIKLGVTRGTVVGTLDRLQLKAKQCFSTSVDDRIRVSYPR